MQDFCQINTKKATFVDFCTHFRGILGYFGVVSDRRQKTRDRRQNLPNLTAGKGNQGNRKIVE